MDNVYLSIQLSKFEKEQLKAAAKKQGYQCLSGWVRLVLMGEVKRRQ